MLREAAPGAQKLHGAPVACNRRRRRGVALKRKLQLRDARALVGRDGLAEARPLLAKRTTVTADKSRHNLFPLMFPGFRANRDPEIPA
eukprot:1966897-Pyramimonas_sp.AAC.1